jgi:hypothetical protein
MAASEACREVEAITGQRPHIATVQRWMLRGLAGVRLRTVYAMGCRRTRPSWLAEFFVAVAAAKDGQMPMPSSTRSDAVSRAERELRDAGI